MVKSGAVEIIFNSHKPFQSYLLLARPKPPFWLKWLGQLAGSSERARGIWKYFI
jgi:hypothetical protein